jgi:hypothetical protein
LITREISGSVPTPEKKQAAGKATVHDVVRRVAKIHPPLLRLSAR